MSCSLSLHPDAQRYYGQHEAAKHKLLKVLNAATGTIAREAASMLSAALKHATISALDHLALHVKVIDAMKLALHVKVIDVMQLALNVEVIDVRQLAMLR